MGLERWTVTPDGVAPDDWGDWLRADDVDALLARIRAAVAAERGASEDPAYQEDFDERDRARAALDALLADGETIHQCPPDGGGGIMPCCGRTPFETNGDRMASDPSLVTCTGRGGQ